MNDKKTFIINNHEWLIEIKPEQELLEEYHKRQPNAYSCMGLTFYKEHKIWIASELCKDEKMRTLKHELTHCYIWENGFYNVDFNNEELICDFMASIFDFIKEVLKYMNEGFKFNVDDNITDEQINNSMKNISKTIAKNIDDKVIKEILHCIEMNCKHNQCFNGVVLDKEECKLLLDCITNLQQENERLNNLVDSTTQLYLKELSEKGRVDDLACKMFNTLDGNK